MKSSVSWNQGSRAHCCPAHHGCQRLSSKSLAFRGKSPASHRLHQQCRNHDTTQQNSQGTVSGCLLQPCSVARWPPLALLAGWSKVAQMLRCHQVSGQETLSPAVSACARFSVVLASHWKQHAGGCFWARTLQLQVRKGSPQTPPWPSMEGEECSLEIDCHRHLRWHEPCIVLAGTLPEKAAPASLFKEHAGRRGGEPRPGACSALLPVSGRPRVQLPATLNLTSAFAPVAPGQALFSTCLPMDQHNLQTPKTFLCQHSCRAFHSAP